MFRLIPALALILLLAACTQSNIASDVTPTATAGEVSGPIPQPAATEGWQEVEAPGWPSQSGFALKLPQGWELRELHRIDPYVEEQRVAFAIFLLIQARTP